MKTSIYTLLTALLCLTLVKFSEAQSQVSPHTGPSKLQIQWDTTSLRKIAVGGYARMVELPHGKLVTIYAAANGNTEAALSMDGGDHWSDPIVVAARKNNVRMDAPDILLLQDGSLLVCYNPRPAGTPATEHFAIAVAKSYDGGLSWKEQQVLYEAGTSFGDGCWEPAAVQLPSGEIQVFFSNEGIYTQTSEQNISRLRSQDNGKTWSRIPEIVAYRKGSRDGMPVPFFSKKANEIVCSIEDNGYFNFKPYILRVPGGTASTITGDSRRRTYALQDSLPGKVYAGAPYLREYNDHITLLSYQSTEFRSGKNDVQNAEMIVRIGDASAVNFTNPSRPFTTDPGKTSLWNSLTVLKNGTVMALTSTSNYGPRTEVCLIKGFLLFPVK